MKNSLLKTSFAFLLLAPTTTIVSAQNDNARRSLNGSGERKTADSTAAPANALISGSPVKAEKQSAENQLPAEETNTKNTKKSFTFGEASANCLSAGYQSNRRTGETFGYKNFSAVVSAFNRKTSRNLQADVVAKHDSDDAQIRRNRFRIGDLEATRRDDGRQHRRREHAGRRLDLLFHRADGETSD